MEILIIIAIFAALFGLLTFWHFPADWLFQNHKEAITKSKDRKVRAWHCLKYAAAFVPLLLLLRVRMDSGAPMVDIDVHFYAALAILFVTHYIIDSYIPVMLWAKYVRKDPHFLQVRPKTKPNEKKEPRKGWEDKVVDEPTGGYLYENDGKALEAMFSVPVGAILCITMDQLFHIICLLPVAILMMR